MQDAQSFIDGLYKGVDPSKTRLADDLQSIGQRVLGKVCHLQKHLPVKINAIQRDVDQIRDVLGARFVDYVGRTGFTRKDVKYCQSALSEMQELLFNCGLKKLLHEVNVCEQDFGKKQGGYEQCMSQQEAEWRARHKSL